jgi:hypothetical protein
VSVEGIAVPLSFSISVLPMNMELVSLGTKTKKFDFNLVMTQLCYFFAEKCQWGIPLCTNIRKAMLLTHCVRFLCEGEVMWSILARNMSHFFIISDILFSLIHRW